MEFVDSCYNHGPLEFMDTILLKQEHVFHLLNHMT
jgi:hypothetical protein